ncbi:MAG: winged helix-turn-helix domain-containing protein [bacterium]
MTLAGSRQGSDASRRARQNTPPLVVLIGDDGKDPSRIAELLDTGALIVVAPDIGAVRGWLPGALLGGQKPDLPHVIVRVSHLEIDLTELQARWLDRVLDLSDHELRLLAALAEDPGRVWGFEELNRKVWGTSFYGGRETIHSAVKRLRKKLARAGAEVRIESIRGVGFRLRDRSRRTRKSLWPEC